MNKLNRTVPLGVQSSLNMAADDPADLELPPELMRAMGQAVLANVVDFIASLPGQPACGDVEAADLCRALRERAGAWRADFGPARPTFS